MIYVLLMAVISVALFFVFSWGFQQDRTYWETMDYLPHSKLVLWISCGEG